MRRYVPGAIVDGWVLTRPVARALLGIGRDQDFRVRFATAQDECRGQAPAQQQHGDLRQRRTGGHGRYLREGLLYVFSYYLQAKVDGAP